MDYFKELEVLLQNYLEKAQIEECRHAYLVAEKAHSGQMRRTGEPYISHPVAAALILANMRLDYQTIMATLLHDVVEDTSIKQEELIKLFGKEVTALVNGVTKLTKIKFESRAEAQAENFRKMVLAMVKDIRVIIVKLADRYHNMLTLKIMPAVKRKRIAIETLEIYAPIAKRLGMHAMYTALEDLCFQALYPLRYRAIKSAVEKAQGNRRELKQKIEHDLEAALKHLNISYEHIVGRQKHLYSTYRKMRQKKASFNEITDVFAFRVTTDDIDSCYRVLGALHQTYKPVPQRFKDYIGIPKANGYQSLHTTLFGPFGVPLEVQIRTKEMDKVAENGVAAHWLYKAEGLVVNEAQLRAHEWAQRLLDLQGSGNSLEFIENVKIDLFPDEVYVFTPQGHIMELPKGATPIDFAYAIHSDIGNSCVAVKINRRLAPLSMQLHNGQTVEIITNVTSHPNPNWLNFVVTGKARSNIRHFLKNQQHTELINFGNRLLEQACNELGNEYAKVPKESLKSLARDLDFKSIEDLIYAVAIGNQMAMVIAKRLIATPENEELTTQKHNAPLAIKGTEGMVIHFAECCQPIPGDNIVGRFEQGRGIMVHISHCKQLNHPGRHKVKDLISLCWDAKVHGEFWVDLTVVVANERGVLANLAAAISESDSNIGNINIDPRDGRYNLITFSISVRNRVHLARVIRRLRMLKVVSHIYRKKLEE